MQTHIVLISGKQGSGKTTTAKELLKTAHRFKGWRAEIMNFADPIYEIHNMARGRMTSFGLTPPENVKIKDGPLLQHLGTEWGRKTYGDDVWVNVLKNRIKQTEERLKGTFAHLLFIVADCRFENEFNAFPTAMKARLNAPEEVRKARAEQWRTNTHHISETDLDDYAWENKFDHYFLSDEVSATGIADLIFHQLLKE